MDPKCISIETQSEYLIDHLPLVIYVHYPEATWEIGSLSQGVYPLRPRTRTWKVSKYTGIAARRKGYTLLPDFASTAHMIQGATLDAAYLDALEASCRVSLL